MFYSSAYSQETGRAGRDGLPAEAIMYFNKEDIGKSTVRPEVREYCLLESCRRKYLCVHFGTPNHSVFDKTLLHCCCDNCEKLCECVQCTRNREYTPPTAVEDDSHDSSVEEAIQAALLNVFCMINSEEQSAIDAELLTGLTPTLATDVAVNYHLLFNLDTLLVNYFHLRRDLLEIIHSIIIQCRDLINSE